MRINKLVIVSSFFCFVSIFVACNPNPETPEKNIVTNSDSTPQSSRDSIAKGTTVTPSPSAIPSK